MCIIWHTWYFQSTVLIHIYVFLFLVCFECNTLELLIVKSPKPRFTILAQSCIVSMMTWFIRAKKFNLGICNVFPILSKIGFGILNVERFYCPFAKLHKPFILPAVHPINTLCNGLIHSSRDKSMNKIVASPVYIQFLYGRTVDIHSSAFSQQRTNLNLFYSSHKKLYF